MPYTPRPMPQTSLSPDSDVAKLSQYIDEEQRTIARAMQEVEQMQYTVLAVAPDRPREGMIAYSSGAWGGSGAGLYQFRNTLWRKLFDTYDGSVSYLPLNAPKFFAAAFSNQGGFPHANWGIMVFTTINYNTGGYYRGNSYFQPPAGRIHINAGFQALPDAGVATESAITFWRNGAHISVQVLNAASFGRSSGTISMDFFTNGSDYFQVGVFTTSSVGANSTIENGWFSGHWIGST